jgi:Spy/CpxP family protein refolding chaperone
MNHIRLLATGIVLMFAMTVAAQTAPSGAEQNQSSGPIMSPVERHLKVLSEKLDLTSDQQDGVRPILQEMHDSMHKADQDSSLSNDQRMDQLKTARMKADKQIREVLSDDQKKKLDQLEQGMHPGAAREVKQGSAISVQRGNRDQAPGTTLLPALRFAQDGAPSVVPEQRKSRSLRSMRTSVGMTR